MRKSTGNTCAWEQRKLSDFAQRESAFRVSSAECPSVEYEDVVAEEGRLNKDIRRKETQKTGIAFDGTQVLYGKLRPYLHNWLNPDFVGVAVGDWWVLKPVRMNKKFLYRMLQTQRFDEVANQSSGSKMPRADWNLVSNTEFIIPPTSDEQRRIAETFDDLDTLITLHQREESCAASFSASCFGTLKAFFWEQRKLGDLVQFSKGTGYSKGDLRESGTPIILYGRLYTKYETVISEVDTFADAKAGSVYSRGGEVIVPASGETAEDISIASVVEKSGVLLGGDLNIITPPADLDAPFLAISISNGKPHEDMAKMAQGKSVVHLHNTDLERIDLTYPSHEEQIQISGYFGALDHLITLHQCKPKSRKGGSHVLYSYQV